LKELPYKGKMTWFVVPHDHWCFALTLSRPFYHAPLF
jgi:hypothetical protein